MTHKIGYWMRFFGDIVEDNHKKDIDFPKPPAKHTRMDCHILVNVMAGALVDKGSLGQKGTSDYIKTLNI